MPINIRKGHQILKLQNDQLPYSRIFFQESWWYSYWCWDTMVNSMTNDQIKVHVSKVAAFKSATAVSLHSHFKWHIFINYCKHSTINWNVHFIKFSKINVMNTTHSWAYLSCTDRLVSFNHLGRQYTFSCYFFPCSSRFCNPEIMSNYFAQLVPYSINWSRFLTGTAFQCNIFIFMQSM